MTKSMKIALGFAAFMGLITFLVFNAHKNDPQDPKLVEQRKTEELAQHKQEADLRDWSKKTVDLMLKKGGLRQIEPASHKAWVDALFWLEADAQLKESVTRAIAIYCGSQVEVFDAQSAKKVASYDVWNGFKAY